MNKKTVILVLRSGGDFSFRDVELLAYHLHKHWDGNDKLQVICVWDKIKKETVLSFCTLIPMPYIEWKGWWSKMNLFSPQLDKYRPFLYLDLDTAVVGGFHSLFQVGERRGFVGLWDFGKRGGFASGIMYFPKREENINAIWDTWILNPNKFMRIYRGDQNFISNFIKSITYWQNEMNEICSFKMRGADHSWLHKKLEGVYVICFHGKPRIFEAAKTVNWVKEYVQCV